MSDSVDFDRDYVDYQVGFGNREDNFWIGLEAIHVLSRNGVKLRIEVTDWNDRVYFAEYKTFQVENSTNNYLLTVKDYDTRSDLCGSIYSITSNNGQIFSTKG